ncbi:MAG: GNAT family N-acetyltransferase [Shinella sp.]|nr:MAG: GNAT family N-acetyltransferase [Shinella sp.]
MPDHKSVSIRDARPEDVDLLHSGILALADHVGSQHKVLSTPADLLLHGFGERPAFDGLIAEVDGHFAGMCLTFASFSTFRGEPGIYVQDLYVEEIFRGKRIGERLLQAAAVRGFEKGARYLRLSVDTGNTQAQGFYERVGITHSRDEQIHMIKGEDFTDLARRGI